MKIGPWDLDREVLVVAEIGNNHEGSYSLAEEMVGRAAAAGAGAVKFQTFRTEHYVSQREAARFERLKSFELSHGDFERLARVARGAGLLFLSTPFDLESAAFLNNLVPAFKIASGDNNFYPLLEAVAGFGKPILLSTGLADLDQLGRSKSVIEQAWARAEVSAEVAVLHCVSGYPVPPAQANLGAISLLGRALGCTVGYSDHTLGVKAAPLAVALGARIIEKHFTLDKRHSDFHDHQLSADPAELAELVRSLKEVSVFCGNGEKVVQDSERANMVTARRSIVAARDLPAGAAVARADITWVRPGGGLAPGEEHRVVGRVLAISVKQGDMIVPEALAEVAEPCALLS